MRKIEQWMLDKIKHHQHLFATSPYAMQEEEDTNGNTRVVSRPREDGEIITSVYLHGNLIAQSGVCDWGFNLCGWPSPTTRSRINALCREFGYVGVNQSKGKQWCGSTEVGVHGWFWPRKNNV